MVTIYGKDGCPYTEAALDDYAARDVPAQYVNIAKDRDAMARMLVLSGGRRCVPVIDDDGKVIVGFGGT